MAKKKKKTKPDKEIKKAVKALVEKWSKGDMTWEEFVSAINDLDAESEEGQ